MSKIVAIIPARYGSTRFPGKALFPLDGKPLVQHVWERCLKARELSKVVIATDDMRIAEAAFDFGAEVAMTSPKHRSGTDRIAEVAAKMRGISHVINVQGDEPIVDPKLIDRLAHTLRKHPKLDMVTAANPFTAGETPDNPNAVKVVTNLDGDALYFSRSTIPFDRDGTNAGRYYRHQGIYGYSHRFLLKFVQWKPTALENAEQLEQLRALEHGARIRVLLTKRPSIGIDTPEDVHLFHAWNPKS